MMEMARVAFSILLVALPAPLRTASRIGVVGLPLLSALTPPPHPPHLPLKEIHTA